MIEIGLEKEKEQEEGPERKVRRRNASAHELVAAPPYCKFVTGKWKKTYKFLYQQRR